MLNVNSKLQTLFARGGAFVPVRLHVARLTTVLFVVITAMFILTGCGLGSLIKAVNSGNLPCNINPFQEMCYPTPRVVVEREKIELLENLTPEQIKQRNADIKAREAQAAKRKAELAKYAPQRKALIEPVVAECTVNPLAARCRDAFVWCSDFENTNSPECATALAAQTGVFSCLKDPYNEACEQQPALQETITGQVTVRDTNGDAMLDDNGEEVTEEKQVSLVQNTRQARINYCRGTNDQGVPNIEIETNAVLCESTVTNVCNDPKNPSGVFDVFCEGEFYDTRRSDIVNGCNAGTLTTVAEGCTSVVKFCNESPFGNSNCDIPAFDEAREERVGICIQASTTTATNKCGIELANNPCFGDPFIHDADGTDGVDCASDLNMGSPENVKTAQQNRAVLCVNAFIAKTYTDVCGGAVANEVCVTDPFGPTCAEDLGAAGVITAQQTRAQYCVVGDKTADPLCSLIQTQACFIDPTGTNCMSFFGDAAYTFIDAEGETQTGTQQDRAQNQRGSYCATVFSTQGGTTVNTLCEAIFVNYCETNQNLFRDSTNPQLPDCLSRTDYDGKRLQFVDECRSGAKNADECGAIINACNNDPFAIYTVNDVTDNTVCLPAHFDGARIAACSDATKADTADCTVTLTRPNVATWLDSFDTPLVALDTSTPKNQFLLGTADGIPTTGTNATDTTLTIANDAKNGVGFFTSNSRFYAGLFNGANLGAPLDDVAQAGIWTGSLRAVVGTSATVSAVLPMELTVVYTGNTRVITAFVASGSNHFLLDGTFTAEGVIDGTVNYGAFTNGVATNPVLDRDTNGILTGIIGQDGALGAFHSNESETSGYAGGFVATKPAE